MLEDAIKELTKAVTILSTTMAVVAAQGGPVDSTKVAKTVRGKAKTAEPALAAERAKTTTTAGQHPDDAPPTGVAATPQPEEGRTYDDVKKAAVRLASEKGRDALLKVLSDMGLKTATDAKPTQYAAIIDKCEAALLV
jgi:hypothetical protein